MKFILIVVGQNEKTIYFGPFDDGEKALDWGANHFNQYYSLILTTLYEPFENE